MEKRSLIIFDIDGTLTDTVEIHQNAFKKALQFIGVEEFNDSFGTYRHHTDSHIAKVIFELATNQLFEKSVIEKFEDHLFDQINHSVINEISGSRQIIHEIETKTDFGVCYATGSLFKPAKLKLESIGINFNLSQLIASNEIEERERILEKAIQNAKEYYKTDKFNRIISFGDGLWDLKTAKNLSLEFIGIGKTNEKILKENGMERHYLDFNRLKITQL